MQHIDRRSHIRAILGKLDLHCEAQLLELPQDELMARCSALTRLEQEIVLRRIKRDDISDIFASPWKDRHKQILEDGNDT